MSQPTTEKKIEYLMQDPTLAEGLIEEAVRRARLMALPEEELNRLCFAKFERRREDAERWRFYSQPNAAADFELLCKVDFWKGPEVAALLLGKDSYSVTWCQLMEFEEHDKQALADFQNLGITGVNLTHYLTKRYIDLTVMLERAEVFLPGTRNVDPVSVLTWARAKGVPIPAPLEAAFAGRKPRPVQALATALAPEQSRATPAPVVTDQTVAVEPAKVGPLPLTTGDIAFCFAGLRWNEQKWKKPLGDKPKWLLACIAIPAVRGVSESRWNPVLIGASLVRAGHTKPKSVRAKFQTQPLLKPWLDEWKTYEADNLPAD